MDCKKEPHFLYFSDSEFNSNLANLNKDKFETIHIISHLDIAPFYSKFRVEIVVAVNEFKKKHGQLLYLQQLKSSEYGTNGGGENPEPCPICTKALGTEWAVLQCGHCFCLECIRVLVSEYTVRKDHQSSVRCAICRNLTFHGEISYVKTKGSDEQEEELDLNVKGSLSTKVEAVVKELLKIQRADPEAKSLVFSTWNGILDIISEALDENEVHYASLANPAGNKFKRNLQKFKVSFFGAKILNLKAFAG